MSIIGNFLSIVVDYLNPFSDNYILKEPLEWLGNFFSNLLDFVIHIFIPTEEHWSDITEDYSDMGSAISEHIPFVSLFSEELEKAQETVEQTNPLIVRIPSFSYSGSGCIGVTTDTKEINLSEFYEPYRVYIRGFLFLIVVGLAFVYIIKYVLNYGKTQSGVKVIDYGRGGELK